MQAEESAATTEGDCQPAEEYGGGSDYSSGAAVRPATDSAQLSSFLRVTSSVSEWKHSDWENWFSTSPGL